MTTMVTIRNDGPDWAELMFYNGSAHFQARESMACGERTLQVVWQRTAADRWVGACERGRLADFHPTRLASVDSPTPGERIAVTGALPPEGLITGRAVPTALRTEGQDGAGLARMQPSVDQGGVHIIGFTLEPPG